MLPTVNNIITKIRTIFGIKIMYFIILCNYIIRLLHIPTYLLTTRKLVVDGILVFHKSLQTRRKILFDIIWCTLHNIISAVGIASIIKFSSRI